MKKFFTFAKGANYPYGKGTRRKSAESLFMKGSIFEIADVASRFGLEREVTDGRDQAVNPKGDHAEEKVGTGPRFPALGL